MVLGYLISNKGLASLIGFSWPQHLTTPTGGFA